MQIQNNSTLNRDKADLSNMNISPSDYLNTSLKCECGREHSASIKQLIIAEESIASLIPLLKVNGFSKAFLLYDQTTFKITGDKINSLLSDAGQAFSYYIIKSHEPVPNEHTIGEVLVNYDSLCDVFIAVGSGTINDLSRFISYKLGIPYMIIATAPSMDGYASNVAPLIINHMKITYEAHAPLVILGDISILKTAPMNMLAAGIGDILGKYTCLCDWEIAHIITGEYYCSYVADIVRSSLETVVANIGAASQKNDAAIKAVMNALILSGIAMSFAGNSRPASGSEHHLSHYWEMNYLFNGKKALLHGTKVGIGAIAVIKAYELLVNRPIDFDKARSYAAEYDTHKWEDDMKKAYRQAAETVIALERKVAKNKPEHVIARIKLLESNWVRLKQLTDKLPSADLMRSYLEALAAPATPMSVGIDKELFIESFIAAKELRDRFGLLQILFDLGLTKQIAEEVWEYFQQDLQYKKQE